MNHSTINASVSMNALQQKLDILANNMANLNTAGYKRKEASFEDILTKVSQQPQSFQQQGRLSPLGFNQGWGAKLSQVSTNFAQGTMKETGLPSDLAIEGDGLFKILAPGGDATQPNGVLYTRDGGFNLTQAAGDNERVYLATKEGNLVLGTDNRPISIPNGHKFSVKEDGSVYSYDSATGESGAVRQGQLAVVRILRPQFLQEVGENRFTIPAGVAPTQQDVDSIVQPVGAAGSRLQSPVYVRQGFLEQSNVDMAEEMTQLMETQRAFQLNSRALSSADTMAGLANNLRG